MRLPQFLLSYNGLYCFVDIVLLFSDIIQSILLNCSFMVYIRGPTCIGAVVSG